MAESATDREMCIRYYPTDFRVVEGLRKQFLKTPAEKREDLGDDDDEPLLTLRDFFVELGVPFPEGSHIAHVPRTGGLVVRNTQENITRLEGVLCRLGQLPTQVILEIRLGPSWSLRCLGSSGNPIAFAGRVPDSALARSGDALPQGTLQLHGEATLVAASDWRHMQMGVELTLSEAGNGELQILSARTAVVVAPGQPVVLACVSADGTDTCSVALTASLADAQGKPLKDPWDTHAPQKTEEKTKDRE